MPSKLEKKLKTENIMNRMNISRNYLLYKYGNEFDLEYKHHLPG